MKRVATSKEAIRWKKTGGGSFTTTINGRRKIIKPGQVFSAKLDEIPEGFRNIVIPVDDVELDDAGKAITSVDVKKLEYTISARGGNWYDVLDSDGKKVNEKSLRKPAAEDLIRSLTE